MKIILRSFWRKDPNVERRLSENVLLSKSIGVGLTFHEFDSDSEEFEHFLDITADMLDGCWFQPFMKFSKREIAQVSMYQVDCRGKLLKETKYDEELNILNLHNTEMLTTGECTKIKLVKNMSLSKIELDENAIGGTKLLEEFVISDFVAELFQKYGLTGFAKLPIYNPKTKNYHQNFFQPYTDNIMPLSVVNLSTIIRANGNDNYSYRELGCLTYHLKDIEKAKDFNRTAENWASNNMPIWIVSSRTKKCYEDNKLKGWYFRPVLQEGSVLYLEYVEKWETLFRRIRINPKNRIS